MARDFIPYVAKALIEKKVTLRCDDKSFDILSNSDLDKGKIENATDNDFYKEYLDLILSIKVVSGVDEAITPALA